MMQYLGRSLTNFKTLAHIDISPPIAAVKGTVLRKVSCRLSWTVPESNGSPVVEYELERL